MIPMDYLRHLSELMTDLGVAVDPWLAEAGLSRDGLAESPAQLQAETFQKLISEAAALSEDSSVGLQLGRRLELSSHGVLGMACATSATLLDALGVLKEYLPVRTRLLSVELRMLADNLQVIVRPAPSLGETSQAVCEMFLVVIKELADQLVPGEGAAMEVDFDYPEPPHSALARDVFECPLRYRQPRTGISFDIERASLPAPQYDANFHAEALNLVKQEMAQVGVGEMLRTRLERLLTERHEAPPPLEEAARLLEMTPRTLHRRLEDEGASFQSILDTVRHRVALDYLLSRRLSVKETAARLGYCNAANFRRAFKRWDGLAPSERQAADRG